MTEQRFFDNEDGTATLLTGTVETGQGSLTVLGQIAAEELGISADDVHVVSADTDATPMDTGAIASRTTYVTGNAIKLAAEKAKEILFEVGGCADLPECTTDLGCGCDNPAPVCGVCDGSIVDAGCGCGNPADAGCGCGESAPDADGCCSPETDLGCGCDDVLKDGTRKLGL